MDRAGIAPAQVRWHLIRLIELSFGYRPPVRPHKFSVAG